MQPKSKVALRFPRPTRRMCQGGFPSILHSANKIGIQLDGSVFFLGMETALNLLCGIRKEMILLGKTTAAAVSSVFRHHGSKNDETTSAIDKAKRTPPEAFPGTTRGKIEQGFKVEKADPKVQDSSTKGWRVSHVHFVGGLQNDTSTKQIHKDKDAADYPKGRWQFVGASTVRHMSQRNSQGEAPLKEHLNGRAGNGHEGSHEVKGALRLVGHSILTKELISNCCCCSWCVSLSSRESL